jgi:transcriptional regulator with XRE-family HTH domain
MENENIIKATRKALGFTYRELGDRIGYSESTLNKCASTGEISVALSKAIELYLQNIEQDKELSKLRQLKVILKDLVDIK